MTSHTKTYPDLVVGSHAGATQTNPEPGLTRKILAYNDKLLLVEHHMALGWSGSVHSHPHDQIVYIVRGHLRLNCSGKTFDVRAGDSFVVRGGVEHGASALEESLVVDVFTPCREDYLA
jgi:quercetin dioxygenase-like cupin family protein